MVQRNWLILLVTALALIFRATLPSDACYGEAPETKPPEKVLIEEGRKGKLGVACRTVPNGALILHVLKDSPAYKVGIEAGDVILSVDGFTIGFIDGLEFPLQSEVRRVKGVGAFKIRNRRTGEVVTKTITLATEKKDGKEEGPPKDPDPKSKPELPKKP
jgi:predicted metalloprotease with PDZ domain